MVDDCAQYLTPKTTFAAYSAFALVGESVAPREKPVLKDLTKILSALTLHSAKLHKMVFGACFTADNFKRKDGLFSCAGSIFFGLIKVSLEDTSS